MEIQQKCSICNNDLISLVTGKKVCRNCGVISSPEPVSSFEQAIDELEQSLPQAPNSGEKDLILMKGTIQSFSRNLGIIEGEDKALYQFNWKDWKERGGSWPDKGKLVTFEKKDSAWACNIKLQEIEKQKAMDAASKEGGCGCFVILFFLGLLLFSGKDQSSTSPSNQDVTECSGKATQEYISTNGNSIKSNEDIAYGRVLIGKHCGF